MRAKEITKIEMYQPRTAMGGKGAPRGKTKMYVYKDPCLGVTISPYCPSYTKSEFGPCRGYINIKHPAIMFGTRDEILADFRRACLDELLKMQLIRENEIYN